MLCSKQFKTAQIPGVACLLVAALLWVGTGSAHAQNPAANAQYQVDTGSVRPADRSKLISAMATVLRGGEFSPQVAADFDLYWNESFFPDMSNPVNLPNLGRQREFLRRALRTAANQPARERLLQLSVQRMQSWIDGNYHPHIKYEAVLILGLLNEREPGTSASSPPAIPYRAAVPTLVAVFQNPQTTDGMRVAAMRGLIRHAEAKTLTEEQITATRNAALALLSEKDVPNARDPQAHDFLRGRAADLLATLGISNQNANVVTALEAVLTDDSASIQLRTRVASALGRLNLAEAGTRDATAMIQALGRLAVAASRAELTNFNNTTNPDAIASGRRLLHRLNDILEGLQGAPGSQPTGGLVTLAPDGDARQLLDNVSTNIRALMKPSQTDPISDVTAVEIRKATEALATLVGARPETAPAAQPPRPAAQGANSSTARNPQPPRRSTTAVPGARPGSRPITTK